MPTWLTDVEGQKTAQRVWDILVKELDLIEPGSVNATLSI